MGFWQGVLTTFRVIQFLLSLVALGCGAFSQLLPSSSIQLTLPVVHTMFSMAEPANNLQLALERLAKESITDADTLTDFMVPILRNFQETPTRAILVMVTVSLPVRPIILNLQSPIFNMSLSRVFPPGPRDLGLGGPKSTHSLIILLLSSSSNIHPHPNTTQALFSLITITYIFFAHRSTHQSLNKRRYSLSLEFLTLLLWLAAIACAVLLSLQYGILLFSGGVTAKALLKIPTIKDNLTKLLLEIIGTVAKNANENVENTLDLVDSMSTVGIMAIVSAGASVVCACVAMVSFFVACCTKSKQSNGSGPRREYQSRYVSGDGQVYGKDVVQVQDWPSPQTPGSPYHYGQIPQIGHQIV